MVEIIVNSQNFCFYMRKCKSRTFMVLDHLHQAKRNLKTVERKCMSNHKKYHLDLCLYGKHFYFTISCDILQLFFLGY